MKKYVIIILTMFLMTPIVFAEEEQAFDSSDELVEDSQRIHYDQITPKVKRKMKKLHEKHPDLSRRQLYYAVTHPRKAKAAKRIKEKHPDATNKQIKKALKHRKRARVAHKIKENHPDASERQIKKSMKHRKKKCKTQNHKKGI